MGFAGQSALRKGNVIFNPNGNFSTDLAATADAAGLAGPRSVRSETSADAAAVPAIVADVIPASTAA